MSYFAGQEGVATRATPERIERLLRPEVGFRRDRRGYVDTLPDAHTPPPGWAQAAWQTRLGSRFWQAIQPALASLLVPAYRGVTAALHLEPGQTVADVGCGPGNVTTTLADAVAPHGLAIGLDLSAPMLARAAGQARPNMGLVRADAAGLPLRDRCVDAACATAVVMLVPEPAEALAELMRIVAPGGWLMIMVPARVTGPLAPLTRPATDLATRVGGARQFAPDEPATLLEQLGCDRIHTRHQGVMLTVRARVPAGTPRGHPAARTQRTGDTRRSQTSAAADTADFDALYRGDFDSFNRAGHEQGAGMELDRVPWDIGEAQPLVRELESAGEITSEVLDMGCGPGENTLLLAERGYRACGVDAAPAAIETARERARQRDLADDVEFAVADATGLAGYADRFSTVLDSALYHCLTEQQRHSYMAALHRACRPGALLHMLCFSEALPEDFPGPYRISEANLRYTLPTAGWEIERLEQSTYTTAFTHEELRAAASATGFERDSRARLLAPVWRVTAKRA